MIPASGHESTSTIPQVAHARQRPLSNCLPHEPAARLLVRHWAPSRCRAEAKAWRPAMRRGDDLREYRIENAALSNRLAGSG